MRAPDGSGALPSRPDESGPPAGGDSIEEHPLSDVRGDG
jgi:hypothetical protein